MKRLILAGGGHGHVSVLKRLRTFPIKDWEIVLISDKKHQYYSGMISDYVAGNYTFEDVTFDLDDLCNKTKIPFFREKILEINPVQKKVITENRTLNYDLLSMDLGSRTYPLHASNYTVKPLNQLMQIREDITRKKSGRFVIIGSGASAIELAFGYRQYIKKNKWPVELMIIGSDDLLRDFPRAAQDRIKDKLKEKNIHYIKGKVQSVSDSIIYTETEEIPYTFCLQATGPRPIDIEFPEFEISQKGYIEVDQYLRAKNYSDVLAMGDMIEFTPYPLPKVGVYAIRQSPILWENIKAIILDRPLRPFVPQKNFLGIISFGDRTAVAKYRGKTFYGKVLFFLKSLIDRRFMEKNKK